MRKRISTSDQPLAKQYYICKSCKTRFLNKTPLFRSAVNCPKCGSREVSQDKEVLY